MLDFDTMLLHVGEFGLYQKILFTFQAPFCIFVTFVLFGQVFMVLYPQNYWCEEHFACLEIDSEINAAQRKNISLRWLEPGLFKDACETNYVDDAFLEELDALEDNRCQFVNSSTNCEIDMKDTRSRPRPSTTKPPPRRTPRPPVGPPYRLEGESETLLRRKRQGSYGNWDRPKKFPTSSTTKSSIIFEDDQEYEQGPGYQNGKRENDYSSSYGNSPNSGRNNGNSGNNWYQNGGPQSGPNYGTTRRPVPNYWGRKTTTTTRTTTSSYYPDYTDPDSGPGFGTGNTDNGNRPGIQRPKPPSRNDKEAEKEKLRRIKANPKFKDFRPSRLIKTPLNSAFAGWPWPECKSKKELSIKFHGRAMFFAQNIKRPFPNNNTYGWFGNCKARWNRSELPYETIVTEGKWWCNAEAYITISQAVFFLGAIVGGFLIGWIADTFGRVPALVIANILGAVGGALSAISTEIWLFSIFRFITGMAFDNSMTMMYILVLEFCGPSYRTLVANLSIAIFYTLGTIILPILAYYIGNWRIYALVISLPMLLALLALFFVPESARWLLSKGRSKEAVNILRNFAKVNRRKVDEHVFVDFEREASELFAQLEHEEEEPSLKAAFRTPRLRRTFMLLIIFWSLIALVYDGHSRNIINLANDELNVFWMFGIASMTEFPADILLIFTLDRFGRRWLAFGAMTLSGAFSIIAAAITPEMRIGFLITAIISRFWVNVAFNIGLQYAAELLPTVIRAQGVNAIHIMGYVASIISPFVAAIGRSNPTLSLILLGAFAIAAGITALFLAETLGEDLPNTLEEAEAFGKDQSFWNCPICSKEWDDEEPIRPPPESLAAEERSVVLRNALRGSIRGETYRSSMISQASSGSGGFRRSQRLRSGRNRVMQAPEPTEMTKLRRITH